MLPCSYVTCTKAVPFFSPHNQSDLHDKNSVWTERFADIAGCISFVITVAGKTAAVTFWNQLQAVTVRFFHIKWPCEGLCDYQRGPVCMCELVQILSLLGKILAQCQWGGHWNRTPQRRGRGVGGGKYWGFLHNQQTFLVCRKNWFFKKKLKKLKTKHQLSMNGAY